MTKAEWQELVRHFIEGELDGPAFERQFLDATRAATDKGESVPYAIDLLFYEVDAYSALPELRGPNDLDEAGLREAARRLIERMDEPWPKLPGDPRNDDEAMARFKRVIAELGLSKSDDS